MKCFYGWHWEDLGDGVAFKRLWPCDGKGDPHD